MNENDRYPVKKICVCDGDTTIADTIGTLLEAERYEVHVCHTVSQLHKALDSDRFDLLIVDADIFDLSDQGHYKQIRYASQAPVIFLVSRSEGIDGVAEFDASSDDYIIKPFKARELIARVKARLRSNAPQSASDLITRRIPLKIRGLELDEVKYVATLHSLPLNLTPKEFAILACLMRAGGRPLSPQSLFEAVWNERADARCNNTVMVHIRHLRQKLRAADVHHEYIETVWGVGYRIV